MNQPGTRRSRRCVPLLALPLLLWGAGRIGAQDTKSPGSAQGISQVQEVRDPAAWPQVTAAPRTITVNGSAAALSFTPDSAALASWQPRGHALYVQDVPTGKELRRIPYANSSVNAITFAPDGKSFATGDITFFVQLWDLESGKVTKSLGELDGSAGFVQFSSKGRAVAVVASGLRVFDVSTGKETFRSGGYHDYIDRSGNKVHGPTEWYSSLAVSGDGRWMASAHSGSLEDEDWDLKWTIRIWEVPGGKEAFHFEGHRGKVHAAAFSPDGKKLATVGADRTLRIWDVEGSRELLQVKMEDKGAPQRVAYFPDGKRLAVGMASHYDDKRKIHESGDFTIRIYDASSGAGLARLPAHEGGVASMAFSPNGKWLASCGQGGSIFLWEVASLAATGPAPQKGVEKEAYAIKPGHLEALLREVSPQIEKTMGRTFKELPKVVSSTSEAVRDILADELESGVRIQFPDQQPNRQREVALQTAEMLSHVFLGKYEPAKNCVHLIPGNFDELYKLMRKPVILTPEFLRLIVIHELVHAMDGQEHHVFSKIASLKSADELSVWNVLIEGHAQYVTRAVLAAGKQERLFADYEDLLQTNPPSTSEGEKFMAQVLGSTLRAPYIDGRRFFDGLAASGKKTFLEDVFAKAPTSMNVILHPERYYDPTAGPAGRDVTVILDEIAKARSEWVSRKMKIGELEIRTSFGDFVDQREVAGVSSHVIGGQAVVVGPEDGSKMMVVLVLETDTVATASKFFDLFAKLSRAKEERMKEGVIRIVKADRVPLKEVSGASTELTRMTIQAGPQTVRTSDVVAVSGPWVLEVLHSNVEASDGDISGILKRILEFLKTEK